MPAVLIQAVGGVSVELARISSLFWLLALMGLTYRIARRLHSVDAGQARATFAAGVAGLLAPGGLWLSVIGSADTPPRDMGPPQVSAREITQAVEDHFEILLLDCSKHFCK